MNSISGTFTVALEPLTPHLQAEHEMTTQRMAIAKTYEGELAGRSVGEMLSITTSQPGSAGYVAIEQFVGTLEHKSGSFVLQHSDAVNKGSSVLQVDIVADSGTAELAGLSGTMQINIENGQHFYTLNYQL